MGGYTGAVLSAADVASGGQNCKAAGRKREEAQGHLRPPGSFFSGLKGLSGTCYITASSLRRVEDGGCSVGGVGGLCCGGDEQKGHSRSQTGQNLIYSKS